MFVERQTVSATVHAGLDQEQVPGTAASCGPRARRTSAARFICCPEHAEGNKASSGVGLQIVVIGELKLPARDEGVPPMNHGDSRGKVVLCVFVRNRTLSLAVSYQRVRNGEIGRQGGSLYGGDCAVVRRRKTLLRNVEPGIVRCTEVAETAGADTHARQECRTNCVN